MYLVAQLSSKPLNSPQYENAPSSQGKKGRGRVAPIYIYISPNLSFILPFIQLKYYNPTVLTK
jgi:hypothetical protein